MYRLENGVEWTEGLKTAFKQNVKRAKVICGNIEINEENYLSNLVIEEQRYISDYGFVGTATARKLELNFLDSAGNINLENQELTVKIGAEYNGQTYYINYGNFMVDKAPERDETSGKVRVVAYDYMKRFDKPYESSVTYPCTLLQVLQDVCTQANVVLGTTDFANNDFIVENNQFEGYTLRQVLQNIGKCAFSWARIGQDNRLYLDFSLVADNTETLTRDDYYYDKFKKAMEYYGPVNQVTYADSDIEGQEEMVQDQASITENGLKELVIYNNLFAYTVEKRTALIQAGTRLFGLRYMPIKQLDMKGLIYLDSRDVINIEISDGQTFTSRVFNHTIEYNGSTNDSIVTEGTSNNEEAYKNTATNIYQDEQTRLRVNKAEKNIDSLVSDMYEEDGLVHENFTQIYQDIDNISQSVQNSGGTNLIKNSVMFAYDSNGVPNEWDLSGSGTIAISSSTEALANGGISGHIFTLNDKTVKQTVTVKANSEGDLNKVYYTFSTKIKKNLAGSCYVKLYNSQEEHTISIPVGTNAYYKEYVLEGLLPKENYYIVEFYGSSGSDATFTDSMLNIGETKRQWGQANGEIMNTQVNVNINGVLVKSSVYQGDYTVMSPLEFAGYSNINGVITKVFTINKDTTEVEKLKSRKSISMSPIKIVPITTGNLQGWAFVPSTD